MSMQSARRYDRYKRLADVVLASIGLAATAPIQILVAVAVRRHLGSPVLFRQQRPGLHGKPFVLIKFRTMNAEDAAANGGASDGARLTAFGRWLRATSLDELPTLWNVMRGDMSLVGPRPLLMAYLDRYSSEQARRHEIRPGITGLAQVRGRNTLTWQDKLASDVEYVNNRNLALDLRILARSVSRVLRREGTSAPGEATMGEFLGEGSEGVDS